MNRRRVERCAGGGKERGFPVDMMGVKGVVPRKETSRSNVADSRIGPRVASCLSGVSLG